MLWECFCCFLTEQVSLYTMYMQHLSGLLEVSCLYDRSSKINRCWFQNASTQMLPETEFTEADFLKSGKETETQ